MAAYLRLSRDDGSDGGFGESNSIRSQRDLLRNYIRGQDDMEIYDFYVDDGWSGVDFDRPSFRKMMADIAAGHVNCVLVKDLSRFGRDYIEAGRLIQKTFPAFSVRFIALNDDFDSLTADYNERALVVPVKNFVNDAYCSDISKKVRSHQKMKRERGEFIGAFAVYGYRKDASDIHHLLIDEYAAGIVRKIFAWRLEGYSNHAIAQKLNAQGVLSPMEYKKLQGDKYSSGFVSYAMAKWSAVAVKRILMNEMYTGVMVQGKREKVNYKVKAAREKPKEEWVRVENTHEAVVSAGDFEMVQRLLETDGRAYAGEKKSHMFTGLLFCGDCGKPMIRRINHYKEGEKVYFICPTKNKGLGCSRHSISEEDLKFLILEALRLKLLLFFNKDDMNRRFVKLETMRGTEALDREMEQLRGEWEKYKFLCAGLYEDLKQEIISEEDFRDFRKIYESRRRELECAIHKQEKIREETIKSRQVPEKILRGIKNNWQIDELDRNVLLTFFHRICIYEDNRIYLEFRAEVSYGAYIKE